MARVFALAIFSLVVVWFFCADASAQSTSALVVTACGTPPQTYTAGQFAPVTMDTTGHLCGNTGGGSSTPTSVIIDPTSAASAGITPTPSGSAVASLALKASPGNFYSATAVNVTATAGFCLIINAVSAPTTGSAVTPLEFAVLPASGQCSIGTDAGIPSVFSTGITFLVSSNASPYIFTSGTITAAIWGKVQ